MIYLFLLVPLVLLAIVTAYFFYALKMSKLPGNAKLLVEAWNSIAKKEQD